MTTITENKSIRNRKRSLTEQDGQRLHELHERGGVEIYKRCSVEDLSRGGEVGLDFMAQHIRAESQYTEQQLWDFIATLKQDAADQQLQDHLHNLYSRAAHQMFYDFFEYLQRNLPRNLFLMVQEASSFRKFVQVLNSVGNDAKQAIAAIANGYSATVDPKMPPRFWMQGEELYKVNQVRNKDKHGPVAVSAAQVLEAVLSEQDYLKSINVASMALAIYAKKHAQRLDQDAAKALQEQADLTKEALERYKQVQ